MSSKSPELWATLSDLLGQAIERPAHERSAFLDEVCPDNAELRAEIDQLIDAYEQAQATERFSRGALDLVPAAFPVVAPAGRVGVYHLLKEVGRGGMGSVWLAERDDGVYEQRVAVKIMRAGFLPDESRRRFQAERQILARLEHPCIGRILDGGVAEGGHPYLVMEFVEGLPITEYCDANRLNVDDRLELFLRVCDAVAYAHQNLVVHRDIKPSNILVTAGGDVKLLDFGIAKLLDTDENAEADELPLTRPGMAAMTPEYAAPEQVAEGTITTATDVYALGVVLFEMLTGDRPYHFDARTPSAIEQVICQTEPLRPSTVARGKARQEAAAISPERMARRLRGDLDTIVLKALRKEPERRYPAAAQLADDVRRHRDGLTVLARPDTPGYRIRTFVGRHRVGVAAVSAVAVALVAGLIVSLAQVRIATIERQKASAVNAFLQDMLASPDPYVDGPDVRVVDVLERAEVALPEQFGTRPQIEAAVRQTLGNSFFELGLYDRAETHLARAATLYEASGDGDDLTDTYASLGNLRKRMGDYESADSLLNLALAADRRRYGPSHSRIATGLRALGALRWEQGDYDAAEPLLLESVRMSSLHDGEDSLLVAAAVGHLATLRSDQGRYAEAESLYRRSLALHRMVHGDDHPEVPQTLSHIGIIRDDLEDFETARDLHTEALALFRRIRGDEHPDVAYALANLASVEGKMGHLARADSLQRRAIEINVKSVGEDHPTIGILYNNLAGLLRRGGDANQALDAYRKALGIWRAGLRADHPYVGYGLQNVGAVLAAEGRFDDALPYLTQAHELRSALYAANHPERANTASWYGAVLAETGDLATAESLLVASRDVLRSAFGDDHAMTAGAEARLTSFRLANGQ